MRIPCGVAPDGSPSRVFDFPVEQLVEPAQHPVGIRWFVVRVEEHAGFPPDGPAQCVVIVVIHGFGGEGFAVEVFGVHAFVPFRRHGAPDVAVFAHQGGYQVEQRVTLLRWCQGLDLPPEFAQFPFDEPDRLRLAVRQHPHVPGCHRH